MTTLRDKILKAAQTVIRCQEGLPATVEDWKLISTRNYEFIASVTVAIGEREFVVWVIVNVDTEELYCW